MTSETKHKNIHTESDTEHLQIYGMHKISFTEFFIFLSIISIVIFAIYRLNDPTTLPIKHVRVDGEFRHLSTSVLQKLVEDKVRGGFFNIDVTAIREAVLKEPWVQDVSVHRVWPDGLRVSVNEQIAVSRWKNTGLLNTGGEIFTPDPDTFPDNLPVLDGPEGTEKILLAKYQQVNPQLEKLDMRISEMNLNNRRAWAMVLNNNLRVIVGRSNIEERITRFIEYVQLVLHEKPVKAKQIDLRYTNGFAVQWNENETVFFNKYKDAGRGA